MRRSSMATDHFSMKLTAFGWIGFFGNPEKWNFRSRRRQKILSSSISIQMTMEKYFLERNGLGFVRKIGTRVSFELMKGNEPAQRVGTKTPHDKYPSIVSIRRRRRRQSQRKYHIEFSPHLPSRKKIFPTKIMTNLPTSCHFFGRRLAFELSNRLENPRRQTSVLKN